MEQAQPPRARAIQRKSLRERMLAKCSAIPDAESRKSFRQALEFGKDTALKQSISAYFLRFDSDSTNLAFLTNQAIFDIDSHEGASPDWTITATPIDDIFGFSVYENGAPFLPSPSLGLVVTVRLPGGDFGPYWLATTDHDKKSLHQFLKEITNRLAERGSLWQ